LETSDFLVIGGGIIGLNVALEARRRHPRARITLIEKEMDCGLHASGRNSGVLHAGFYYTSDSFKARFTREGNRRLTQYCAERGLSVNRCGKLVVARNPEELSGLDELLRRAQANGVALEELTAEDARRIEPRVKTFERALFSPSTATVDPAEVMSSFQRDARAAGIDVFTDRAFIGRGRDMVLTSRGPISAGYVINAAGLYADKIARAFGFAAKYRILPFKGLYLYGDESDCLRTNIYPVPDLAHPFLGVHFTLSVHGRIKIGPTAVPAFWRENYGALENFRFRECLEILRDEGRFLLGNHFGFRQLAMREVRKYDKRNMVAMAAALAHDVEPLNYRRWAPSGIRAQLVDVGEAALVMDFRFEGDARSFHILNAVSPAFTCSIPFAEFVMEEIEHRLG
jgi:L-2-hydroxyglutarate oxidase